MPDVIVTGQLGLDLFPDLSALPLAALSIPGQLNEAERLRVTTGGAVSNTGLALHRLGVAVQLMASVGDDALGLVLRDLLERFGAGLSAGVVVRPGENTTCTIVLAPSGVDRIFIQCYGTNRTFDSSHLDWATLRQATWLHLGYPPLLPRLIANDGQELVRLFQRASAQQLVTSLDMSLPDPQGLSGRVNWQTILRRALPLVAVFVPSLAEAVYCLRPADYQRWRGADWTQIDQAYLRSLADELIGMGVLVAGFKLGEYGLYLRSAPAERWQHQPLAELVSVAAWDAAEVYAPAYQAQVVGTTGAGDSAYAALIASLLRGLPPAAAAQMACAVGACSTEADDASSAVRPWSDVQTRLAQGWLTRAERLRPVLA